MFQTLTLRTTKQSLPRTLSVCGSERLLSKKSRWRWWLSDKDLGGSTSVGDDVNATRQDSSGLYLSSTGGVDACGGIGGEDASLANFYKELLLRQ